MSRFLRLTVALFLAGFDLHAIRYGDSYTVSRSWKPDKNADKRAIRKQLRRAKKRLAPDNSGFALRAVAVFSVMTVATAWLWYTTSDQKN